MINWWLFSCGAAQANYKAEGRKSSNQILSQHRRWTARRRAHPLKALAMGLWGVQKKIFQANCECIRPNIISNNTSKNRPTADESARRFPWCLDCPGYGASGAVMFATVSRGKKIRKRTKVIIILVVVHFVQIKVKAQQTVQQRSVYPCLYFIKPKNQTD